MIIEDILNGCINEDPEVSQKGWKQQCYNTDLDCSFIIKKYSDYREAISLINEAKKEGYQITGCYDLDICFRSSSRNRFFLFRIDNHPTDVIDYSTFKDKVEPSSIIKGKLEYNHYALKNTHRNYLQRVGEWITTGIMPESTNIYSFERKKMDYNSQYQNNQLIVDSSKINNTSTNDENTISDVYEQSAEIDELEEKISNLQKEIDSLQSIKEAQKKLIKELREKILNNDSNVIQTVADPEIDTKKVAIEDSKDSDTVLKETISSQDILSNSLNDPKNEDNSPHLNDNDKTEHDVVIKTPTTIIPSDVKPQSISKEQTPSKKESTIVVERISEDEFTSNSFVDGNYQLKIVSKNTIVFTKNPQGSVVCHNKTITLKSLNKRFPYKGFKKYNAIKMSESSFNIKID